MCLYIYLYSLYMFTQQYITFFRLHSDWSSKAYQAPNRDDQNDILANTSKNCSKFWSSTWFANLQPDLANANWSKAYKILQTWLSWLYYIVLLWAYYITASIVSSENSPCVAPTRMHWIAHVWDAAWRDRIWGPEINLSSPFKMQILVVPQVLWFWLYDLYVSPPVSVSVKSVLDMFLDPAGLQHLYDSWRMRSSKRSMAHCIRCAFPWIAGRPANPMHHPCLRTNSTPEKMNLLGLNESVQQHGKSQQETNKKTAVFMPLAMRCCINVTGKRMDKNPHRHWEFFNRAKNKGERLSMSDICEHVLRAGHSTTLAESLRRRHLDQRTHTVRHTQSTLKDQLQP